MATAVRLGLLIFAIVIGIAPSLAGSRVLAQTPPSEWRCFGGGPSRNMVDASSAGIPAKWDLRPKSQGGDLLWRVDLGSRSFAGPVIAGGRIYVGTNNDLPRDARDTNPKLLDPATGKPRPLDKGVLMCFRESDGAFLWQHVSDKLDDPIAHDWPRQGICSTPWIQGDRVYYVTSRGEVTCLDAKGFSENERAVSRAKYRDPTDARVIWSFDMIKELGVQIHRKAASSPLVAGNFVYVVTGNGVDSDKTGVPAPKAPSFIALDKKTGKLVWSDNSPGTSILHGQWSSPAYGVIGGVPQVIFAGGDGWLHAFEPQTGKPIWKFDGNPKTAASVEGNRDALNHFIAAPVVVNERIYIGSGQNPEYDNGPGDLWCIAPAGKKGDISAEIGRLGPDGKAIIEANPNSGVVWHRGGQDLSPNAPQPWRFGRTVSTLDVHDGLLYAVDLRGQCYCLDAKNGELCWQHDLNSSVWSSPIWIDGKVFFATRDGDIHVFEHSRKKNLLSKASFDEPINAAPVAARATLFVMTDRHLYAIKRDPKVR